MDLLRTTRTRAYMPHNTRALALFHETNVSHHDLFVQSPLASVCTSLYSTMTPHLLE